MSKSDTSFRRMYESMAKETVMTAEQERQLAKLLRQAKFDFWNSLLANPSTITDTLSLICDIADQKMKIKQDLESSGFLSLEAAAKRFLKRPLVQASESQLRRRRDEVVKALVAFDHCMEIAIELTRRLADLIGPKDFQDIECSQRKYLEYRNRFIRRNIRLVMIHSTGPSKAALAGRSAALLAAAAQAAGDRVGLLAFDERVVHEVPPGRGEAHHLSVLRALVEAGRAGTGRTALAPVLSLLRERALRRAIVFLLSDLRDAALLGAGAEARRTHALLAAVARRHDVVAGWVHDPLEAALPAVGSLRPADPEAPGRTFLLRSGSRRTRERYRAGGARRGARARRAARERGR